MGEVNSELAKNEDCLRYENEIRKLRVLAKKFVDTTATDGILDFEHLEDFGESSPERIKQNELAVTLANDFIYFVLSFNKTNPSEAVDIKLIKKFDLEKVFYAALGFAINQKRMEDNSK